MQVAATKAGGQDSIVSAMYPDLNDDTFRQALRSGFRACEIISTCVNANRVDETSVGSMHGSGDHLRQDGLIGQYPAVRNMSRKRKRGGHRDQGSARALAEKLLSVWDGELPSPN